MTDLIVKTNRAYSAARMAVRAQEAVVRVSVMTDRAPEHRAELMTMLDERDSLKYLLEALAVRRANLGRTSSDIRLMANIIEAERKPGNANAGPERPKKAAPPIVPPPPEPARVVDFEAGMAAMRQKLAADPDSKPGRPVPETPVVEPEALLAEPVVAPVLEEKAEPEVVTLAGTLPADEVDIEAFLES